MEHVQLKLTAYFGERDHAGGRLLADAIMDLCSSERVQTSVLLRGIEGFGIKHRLQSERLLSLSEDLPAVVIAIDSRERIEVLLDGLHALSSHGVITLERVRPAERGADPAVLTAIAAATVKLTLYLERGARVGGARAYEAAVECLRRHGLDGATVLLGLDGTLAGGRRRARMLAGNEGVPMVVLSIGRADTVSSALGELQAMFPHVAMTLERVRVCKREGATLAGLEEGPPLDESGRAYWQELTVFVSERSRHRRAQLYSELIRRLRRAGASGATAIRGQWGYHAGHSPHGERFWSLRRHVPVIVTVLDTPERMRAWYPIVDELTAQTGLVTSELVPALRAAGPGISHGGLALAAHHGRGDAG